MLDWHSCQICYPLEIKTLLLLLLLEILGEEVYSNQDYCINRIIGIGGRMKRWQIGQTTLIGLGAILTAPLNRTK